MPRRVGGAAALLLLDERTGSGDLAHFFKTWGTPFDLTRLEYGDAAMSGQEPYHTIGVEIKKVRDALTCMCDGRFAGHQLPGLIDTYSLVWLVIEGPYSVDFKTGIMTVSGERGLRRPLMLGKRQFSHMQFDHWLTTMEVKAGLKIKRTTNRTETAAFLVDLMTWWSKPLEKHKSHLAFHETRPDGALLVPPTMVMKVAAQLPGIGWTRAHAVSRHFASVEEMMIADENDWQAVDGVGPGIARAVVESIRRRR